MSLTPEEEALVAWLKRQAALGGNTLIDARQAGALVRRLDARVEELTEALARIERMACSEHDEDDCGPECGPAVARAALQSPTCPHCGSAECKQAGYDRPSKSMCKGVALQSTGEGPVKCDACGSTDGPCVTAPDYGDCAAPTEEPVNLTPAELSASWERLRERIPDLPHVTFIRCDSCDVVKPSDLIDHDPASGINLCKDGKHRAALTGKEGER